MLIQQLQLEWIFIWNINQLYQHQFATSNSFLKPIKSKDVVGSSSEVVFHLIWTHNHHFCHFLSQMKILELLWVVEILPIYNNCVDKSSQQHCPYFTKCTLTFRKDPQPFSDSSISVYNLFHSHMFKAALLMMDNYTGVWGEDPIIPCHHCWEAWR